MREGLLLKMSGEVFLHADILEGVIRELAAISGKVKFALLVGGGNHIRGAQSCTEGEARVFADRMGMIGTLLNGLWLESRLRNAGVDTVHLSSVPLSWVRPYDPVLARELFSQRKILIFSGGTGLPYFSTDTSAVLRAVEIGAFTVLKGTKVDGIYSDDPIANPHAEFFEEITYTEALARDLAVMDQTAFSLAREHNLYIQVFNVFHPENIGHIVAGERVGTIVKRGADR